MGSKMRATFAPAPLYPADGGPALRRLHRAIIDLANPFAGFLAELCEDRGAFPASRVLVEEAEAEGSALIGARSCPQPHGAGGTAPHEVELTPVRVGPCPGCGAAL